MSLILLLALSGSERVALAEQPVKVGDTVRVQPTAAHLDRLPPELAQLSGSWLRGRVSASDTSGLTVLLAGRTDEAKFAYADIERIQIRDISRDIHRNPRAGALVGAGIATALLFTGQEWVRSAQSKPKRWQTRHWSDSKYQSVGGCPLDAQCEKYWTEETVGWCWADCDVRKEVRWRVRTVAAPGVRSVYKVRLDVAAGTVAVGAFFGGLLWSSTEGWVVGSIPPRRTWGRPVAKDLHTSAEGDLFALYGVGAGAGTGYLINRATGFGSILGGALIGGFLGEYFKHKGLASGNPDISLSPPPFAERITLRALWRFG